MRKLYGAAVALGALLLLSIPASALAQAGPYINFETIPTRALALSSDGTRLFVTNVPDGRLEILDVTANGLKPAGSVQVGIDPVAVSARNDKEVWVVNLLSDDVSVVDVSAKPPRVVRTLLVGDEPRDVVFAGPNGDRAFITAAHRGQNHPENTVEQQQVPSTPRADVWVFDAANPGTKLGGQPLAVLPLYSDKPGAMTVSPDGRTVFVAVATSGNDTTTINDSAVCGPKRNGMGAGTGGGLAALLGGLAGGNGAGAGADPNALAALLGGLAGGNGAGAGADPNALAALLGGLAGGNGTGAGTGADPNALAGLLGGLGGIGFGPSSQTDGPCALRNGGMSPGGVLAPNQNQVDKANSPLTGIMVKMNPQNGRWEDAIGRDFTAAVPFTLADNDVFAIDAMANPPRQTAAFQNVGTLNKGLAAHPTNGKLYVATIEAINMNRFLSVPAMNAFPNPDPASGVARTADPATGKTLNGHLYESHITILPMGATGNTNRADTTRHLNKHINYEVVPSPAGVKEKSVADPQGIAFSPDGSTLFVAALGSNQIVPFKTSEIDKDSFTPDASTHIQLSGNGGPTDMVLDAKGEQMFVYKRFDNSVAVVNVAQKRETAVVPLFSPEPATVREGRKFFYDARLGSSNGEANCNVCHPAGDKDDLAWDLGSPFAGMKPNTNPFVGGLRIGNPQFNPLKGPMTVLTLRSIRDSGPLFWRGDATNDRDTKDVRANFQNFNIVFPALLGREDVLPQADFDKFTDFALSMVSPPNPLRNLDNSLNPTQARGMSVFTGGEGGNDGPANCNTCHMLNPPLGFFGTSGMNTGEGESQEFKVTQLRSTYDKVGMFSQTNGRGGDARTNGGPRVNLGAQVRGTGTLHDGSQGGAEDFLTDPQFQLNPDQLKAVVDFIYAFPSNLAPIVGQQVTLRADSAADTKARIDLMEQRAQTAFIMPGNDTRTECELVAKAVVDGQQRGFLFQSENNFMDDRGQTISDADLRRLAQTPGQEVTFTCMYPGSGQRVGLDRDMDGRLDGAAR